MWGWLNKELLPIKLHYFLFNAGTAPVQPFMTVYARQLGFSSFVVGTVYGILPVIGIFSKLFVGALADRFRMRKTLLLIFLVLGIVSFFGVQFVPSVKKVTPNKIEMDCKDQTNLKLCSHNSECLSARVATGYNISCFLQCDLNPQLKHELCNTWHLPSICSLPLATTPTPNSLIATKLDDGKSAYSPENEVPKLQFTADVPLQHTLDVGDCTYFRLQTAVFADKTTHVPYCQQWTRTDCEVECTDGTISQLMRNVTLADDSTVFSLYQFWLLFWLLILSWVAMAVVVTLSDALCFETLGKRAGQYGNQRLWGSIGWGLMAIISGLLVDHFSEGEFEKNYVPAFYLLLILWSADVACCYTLKNEQSKISKNIWSEVGRLIINPHIFIFLVSCVVVGMCTGLQWSFLYWYLEELATSEGCDTLVWIKTLQGLVSGIQCFLGELPYYFVSGWLLQRLGHVHCMSIVLFFLGVRFILYSALTNPWWALPIELLQGVYGLFYPTMVSYANAVSPSGTEATVQGLVGAVFEGVGVALGSFLGGMSYVDFSGSTTFLIFGIGSLIACIAHVLVHYLLSRRVTRYEPKGFIGLNGGNEAVAMLEVN